MTARLVSIVDGAEHLIAAIPITPEVSIPAYNAIQERKSWPEVVSFNGRFFSLEDYNMQEATFVESFGLFLT